MTSIVDLWQNIRAQLTWAERIFQVWDMKPSVVNVANPRLPHRLAGDISVENVSFAYENGFQALHDVSLRIVPGQFAALVGPSGSGKTTLLNLMLRLADPASGRVTMDGVDIREFDYSKYQQSLGIVMQETFLSKETLRWNMMLSNWQADDDEILEALERRRLMNWYRALPAGLDSLLNEGTRVSSGEKQRLGVARALIRKSRVLFLDEPTSSLDLDTEKEVMEVINEVRQGKTTVLVTHRLNTVVNADRLMVMDRGSVVETGTHDELVRNGGIYSRLNDLFYGSKAAA